MGQLLGDGADDLDVDGFGQPRQFFERIPRRPRLSGFFDGDQEGMLGGSVGGKKFAGYGAPRNGR